MTGEEYMDCVKAAWQHFTRLSLFRRVAAHTMLVHGKSTGHCSACVVQGLRDMKRTSTVQHASSPNLMPLYYGIFGPAKNTLDAECPRDQVGGQSRLAERHPDSALSGRHHRRISSPDTGLYRFKWRALRYRAKRAQESDIWTERVVAGGQIELDRWPSNAVTIYKC